MALRDQMKHDKRSAKERKIAGPGLSESAAKFSQDRYDSL
jgi:hypothetical protein